MATLAGRGWPVRRRTGESPRTAADSIHAALDGVDEVERCLLASLVAVVLADVVEIGRCELAEPDGLDHRRLSRADRTRARNNSKYESSTEIRYGGEAAPSSRSSRSRSRSWSRRIRSRTYSLVDPNPPWPTRPSTNDLRSSGSDTFIVDMAIMLPRNGKAVIGRLRGSPILRRRPTCRPAHRGTSSGDYLSENVRSMRNAKSVD